MVKDFETLFQRMEADHKSTGPLRVRLLQYRENCERTRRCLDIDKHSREEFDEALSRQSDHGQIWTGILYGMNACGYLSDTEMGSLFLELTEIEKGEEHESTDDQI